MLKKFGLENFLSFNSLQYLDLTAGTTRNLQTHVRKFTDVGLLKSGAIYGANASGKSNFIRGVDCAKKIVTLGLEDVDIYLKHFRLEKDNILKPTTFSFEIEVNDKFFAYGFNVLFSQSRIVEEWLYEISSSKSKLIFHREGRDFKMGTALIAKKVKDRFAIYVDDISKQPDKLFLTDIAKKNLDMNASKDINTVFNWISQKLEVFYPHDHYCGMSGVDETLTATLTKYLPKFDTGIVTIDTIKQDFDEALARYPKELTNRILKDFSTGKVTEGVLHQDSEADSEYLTIVKENGEIKVKKLGFVHGESEKATFELRDESDGTRRLLDFIPLIGKLSKDYTILVDEFDRSLHPKLTKEFFKLFYDISSNSKGQFIVSTHESTLLDLEFLRRDEIWFVEKQSNDSSKLYSLNKFQERHDKKAETAYLVGRYGAVPSFSTFDVSDEMH